MNDEHRKYPRIASHHSVLVRQVSEDGLEGFAHTRTVAVGGCSVVSSEAVPAGSSLELLIAVEHRVINARGKAVYVRQLSDGRHEIGVEFAPLSDDDAEAIQRVFERPAQVD